MSVRDVTVCITSCGRWELLEKTISSLLTYWDDVPPAAFLIHDDSGAIDAVIVKELDRFLMRHWKIMADWSSSHKKGQVHAIDTLYSKVETPYIFHCEDDWEFFHDGFITDSKSVLEAEPKAACVWIRHPQDRNNHTVIPGINLIKQRVRYQQLAQRYKGDWHGMTWNPGLRRLADYKAIGKFSTFCEWRDNDHAYAEKQYNKKYYEAGYLGYTLCRGFVKHIGHLHSLKKTQVK